MSEDQETKESLDGFVPDQETPKETPSDAAVPEGQEPAGETPAPSDSPEGGAKEAPVKTAEQLKEDAAFYQGKYQNAVEETKAFTADDARRELTSVDGSIDIGAESPGVSVASEAKPATQPGVTDTELQDQLRDNPVLMAQLLREQSVLDTNAAIAEQFKQFEQNQQMQGETDRANETLNRYLGENKIPTKEFDDAKQYLKDRGIKAAPRQVAAMIIDQIELSRLRGGIEGRTRQAAADASQAIKAQALTIQSEGGGEVPISSPKTQEEFVRDKFKTATGPQKLDGLYE